MTLIVGVQCTDGIIIGTDSAMTFTVGQKSHTIKQPFLQKLHVIDHKVIVTSTGQIGLGQRFADIVETYWGKERLYQKRPIDVGRILAQAARKDFMDTGVSPGNLGGLVAFKCKERPPVIIEFEPDNFQPEMKTNDNWYVSMGSGQHVADPLLGFIRKVFWGNAPPNLQEGIFAVTMVLKLGCEMTPFGVDFPVQMATIRQRKNQRIVAQRIAEEELAEHKQNVDEAINYFKQYNNILRKSEEPKATLPSQP